MESGVLYYNSAVVGQSIQDLYLGGKTLKQVLQTINADRNKMFK
ncbi:hypothetical protein [Paenibacillus alba]|nr:hypothetical protein [Paenibacillus alba]